MHHSIFAFMNTPAHTIQDCINLVKNELQTNYPESEINSFTNIIFESLYGFSAIDLYMNKSQVVEKKEFQKFRKIVDGLKINNPIQYLIGTAHFYDLVFDVAPAVLIPRQETEELVRWLIDSNKIQQPNILDIGTGSGCIAISLAKFIPESLVSALDISKDALEIAKQNSQKNNANINFIEYDILKSDTNLELPKMDIIISNPPYVGNSEKANMHANVLQNEPHLALFVPDNDALIFYDAISNFAKRNLKKDGWLYFEINENYGAASKELLQEKGFRNVELKKDLFGKDRMLRGQHYTFTR